MSDDTSRRVGRPRASSRQTLAEAACELFLEHGYEQTSVADITQRAGVSRSSFFNYFDSKSDVLWDVFDDRLRGVIQRLDDRDTAPREALTWLGEGFRPDNLALAVGNADAMGIRDELGRERWLRQGQLATAVAARLRSDGETPLAAEVRAAAAAGGVLAAVWSWAEHGAGSTALSALLDEALAVALPD